MVASEEVEQSHEGRTAKEGKSSQDLNTYFIYPLKGILSEWKDQQVVNNIKRPPPKDFTSEWSLPSHKAKANTGALWVPIESETLHPEKFHSLNEIQVSSSSFCFIIKNTSYHLQHELALCFQIKNALMA